MVRRGSQGKILFKNTQEILERVDVKRVVSKLRGKWSVPTSGFKNSKDYIDWQTSLISQVIRKKIKSGTVSEYEFNLDGERLYLSGFTERKFPSIENEISKYSLFLREVQDACINILNLPPHWRFFLNQFITQGKVNESFYLRSGVTQNTPTIKAIRRTNAKGQEIERKIRLEFGANTGLAEVKKIWNSVKKIQKTIPEYDKVRSKVNLSRDSHALKLKEGGKTHKEIYQDITGSDSFTSEEAVAKALHRKKKIIKGQ